MIRYLVLISSLLFHVIWAQQPAPKPSESQPWKTLSGKRPLVLARGGLSGLFPDSSDYAFTSATALGLKDTILYCDLQLTKDSIPFCLSEIRLDNTTNIALVYPKGQKTYNINGKDVVGWFALDFMASELIPNTSLIQSNLARTDMFDNLSPLVVLDTIIMSNPPGLWVNVQYDTFYNQQKISTTDFLGGYGNLSRIQYLSSPEIGFLKSISSKIDKMKTKLIFKFLQPDAVEPSTKQPYSSILKDLGSIKAFASGILVPKEYIQPVGKDMYLQAPTNLVNDAHKLGLEVFASGFANDIMGSYNYSYDPSMEYLRFIDNSQFSVDGVLTDFVGTASEAIACIAHNENASQPQQGKQVLIISHNGASGDYAACTDLAYEKAVNDGADIIDCSVQMSKDGVAFCSQSPDLTASTTALSTFISQSTAIPEIQQQPGVFSFNLAWSEIQTLSPQLTNFQQNMPRNPAAKNKGKIVTLADFLEFAKKKNVSGILINIENAAYLASKKSLDITKAVTSALKNATMDKQTTQTVYIQSDESAALAMFKSFTSYRKVYTVNKEGATSIDDAAVKEIKKVADTVNLPKYALITLKNFFTSNDTLLVKKMHDANMSVFASTLYNEFTTIPFDMFADPLVNLATFIKGLGVDGVVTDYPATARNYLNSPCVDEKAEYRIQPTQIGNLLSMAGPGGEPPTPSAAPTVVKVEDVVEPPLPSVSNPSTPGSDPKKNASTRNTVVASLFFLIVLILVI